MNHPTSLQLREFVDKVIAGVDDQEINIHIRACDECRSKLRVFRQFDRALQRELLVHTSRDFSAQVMKRLGIQESTSFAWNIVKNLGPVIAFLVIITIVYFVLQMTGTFQGSDIQQSISYTQSASAKAGSAISEGINALNAWSQKYLSFALAKGNYGITLFLLAVFGVIALLDKFLVMPMIRKRL